MALFCVTNQSLWRPQSSFSSILWASDILFVSLESVPSSSHLLKVSYLVLVLLGLGSDFSELLLLWALPLVSSGMMECRLDVTAMCGFLTLWNYALGYFLNLCKFVFLYVTCRNIVRYNNYL